MPSPRRTPCNSPRRRVTPLAFVIIAASLWASALANAETTGTKPGPLVIVGGGGTPPEVVARSIELAGGPEIEIVIIALASRRENAAEGSAKMFRESGARRVHPLAFTEESLAEDKKRIATAGMIWFPGGSQNRLMARLKEYDLVDPIRKRHAEGATIGGTSAGAAVMSQVMITGRAALDKVERGATPAGEGLGLWPGVIVDQHFHRRQRFNRLLSIVSDRPSLVGIGIDERTAVIVHGDRCEVAGESNVAVVDARRAKPTTGAEGSLVEIRGVRLDIIPAGSSFTLSATPDPATPKSTSPPKAGSGGTGGDRPSDGDDPNRSRPVRSESGRS